jgi:hypothetical protein
MTTHDIPIHALAEAEGVFFLTLAKGDRTSIATTVERLINMLDAMEPDPDNEPTLGWSTVGEMGSRDDLEEECEDEGAQCEDEGAQCEDEGAQCEDEGAATGDNEPNLGRLETMHQGIGSYGGLSDDETGLLAGNLDFKSEGYSIGNEMLRAIGANRVRVSPGLPRGKWAELAHKLPDGTIMRTFLAPGDSRSPELRASDFDKLPFA